MLSLVVQLVVFEVAVFVVGDVDVDDVMGAAFSESIAPHEEKPQPERCWKARTPQCASCSRVLRF